MKLFHQTKTEHIIIVGCGLLGSALAAGFAETNSHVTLIDRNRNAFAALPDNFTEDILAGDGTDEEILKQAQVQSCDIFFAVTGDDNTNLMAAQVAKTCFGVKKVFARVDDASKAPAYGPAGITAVSSPLLLCREFRKALGEEEASA
ncbi:MAG: TrkA family potassium uptake protein [Clostridiales bacterium]|jgi:trk system potassium uptake protein TrkA|nr:TrkA family potassium uptake protein [Clostridiales bacterium]